MAGIAGSIGEACTLGSALTRWIPPFWPLSVDCHPDSLHPDSLEREELLALYGCCDVFLSLHRSEGFGRGMAEALQLGLDVIATAYGGNADFCSGPLAHPFAATRCPSPEAPTPVPMAMCGASRILTTPHS